jgi:molybdopterin molybdotransferase
MISPQEALDCILAKVTPIDRVIQVALENAHQCALAESIDAPLSLPSFDNSAMDGYAVMLTDTEQQAYQLPIGQTITAGDPVTPHPPHTACRIFTGAPIPVGADTVIPQESVTVIEENGARIAVFPHTLKKGSHIRRKGEDFLQGTPALLTGTVLQAPHIGLLAALGIGQVSVYDTLKVAILSTGNELVPVGQPLQPGQIYNSNRYMMSALLKHEGCELVCVESVRDDLAETTERLQQLAKQVDIIFTTGGVSVGDTDYVKPAISQLGSIHLWKIAIKPGKPLMIGQINQTLIIGLPGNPISCLVNFYVMIVPILRKLQRKPPQAPAQKLPIDFDIKKLSDREQYLRVQKKILDSKTVLTLTGEQGSHLFSSTLMADGLARIPAYQQISKGHWVDYLPFE